MQYRLVIFDSDGTLADTLPWMRSIFNELADAHGFRRLAAEEHDRFRDLHGMALLRELRLPLWKLPRVLHDMRRRMAEHTGDFTLFPGIGDALEQLVASGARLAIVSSNSHANVERVLGLKHSRLITQFACDVSMFGKRAKLQQILRQTSIPPTNAIYVGDEVRDAEAASAAGLPFGAVTWGQHRETTLRAHNPAHVFNNPREIAEILC